MAKRNYRKMSEKPEVEQTTAPEAVAENETVEPEASKVETIGVVFGCGKLNIRKEPNISAEVVYEALLKSELVIDLDKSTDEWYSVCTPAGVEGFCMKKFVEIK